MRMLSSMMCRTCLDDRRVIKYLVLFNEEPTTPLGDDRRGGRGSLAYGFLRSLALMRAASLPSTRHAPCARRAAAAATARLRAQTRSCRVSIRRKQVTQQISGLLALVDRKITSGQPWLVFMTRLVKSHVPLSVMS